MVEILADKAEVQGSIEIKFDNPVTSDPVNLNVFGVGKGWIIVDLTTVSKAFKLALLYFDSEKKSWGETKYIDQSSTEIESFKSLALLQLSGNQGYTFLSFVTTPEPAEYWSLAICEMEGQGASATFKCIKQEDTKFGIPFK